MSTLRLKTVCDGVVRRFAVPTSTFEEFEKAIRSVHGVPHREIVFRYADEDGDHITMSTIRELKEGIRCAGSSYLRVFLEIKDAVVVDDDDGSDSSDSESSDSDSSDSDSSDGDSESDFVEEDVQAAEPLLGAECKKAKEEEEEEASCLAAGRWQEELQRQAQAEHEEEGRQRREAQRIAEEEQAMRHGEQAFFADMLAHIVSSAQSRHPELLLRKDPEAFAATRAAFMKDLQAATMGWVDDHSAARQYSCQAKDVEYMAPFAGPPFTLSEHANVPFAQPSSSRHSYMSRSTAQQPYTSVAKAKNYTSSI